MMNIELIHASEYDAQMGSRVVPYINARRSERFYEGYDGKQLHAAIFRADAPRGAVVICHGFTESCEKYDEMVYYFLQNGYTVFLPEHRGHGSSFRKLSDYTLTHIDHFAEYVDDFEITVDRVVRREWTGPIMLFAHSMGGAIGVMYMQRHPDTFEKAVLNAPMIAPQTGGVPRWATRMITRGLILLGKREKRSFTARPDAEEDRFERSCSTCRPRFEYYERKKHSHKELSNNAPTYGWIYESVGVTREILRPGAPERIQTSVLLIAADKDHLVKRNAQEALLSRLPKAKFRLMKGTRHETFSSPDPTMKEYLEEIFGFLEE